MPWKVLDSTGSQKGTSTEHGWNVVNANGYGKQEFLESAIDHGGLGGLADDDHTQYASLAGRSGGQSLVGGTGASDDLILRATSHATDGDIIFESDSTPNEMGRFIGGAAHADNNGRLVIGHSSAITGVASQIQRFQVVGSDFRDSALAQYNFDSNTPTVGPVMTLGHSRNNTKGAHTIVASDDRVGIIQIAGSDGTEFRAVAQIEGVVDGTPSGSSMPGRLDFYTTSSGSNIASIKMALKSDGHLRLNEITAPGTPASSTVAFYAKTDGLFYSKDDAGQEDRVSGTQVFAGSFTRDISTASGTQAITGVGFKPRVIHVICSLFAGENQISYGWMQSSSVAGIVESIGNQYFDQSTTIGIIARTVAASGDYSHATLSSMDSDGFTLSWTKVGSPSGTATIRFLAVR